MIIENFNTYRNKLLIIVGLILLSLLLNSCGEGVVDVSEAKYEPKIVISGYIYPDQPVRNIQITRNFPLNKKTSEASIQLPDADVRLTDLSTGKEYKLTYNDIESSFECQENSSLSIKYGNSYKLTVKAVIDGKSLQASSTTTVPLRGFKLLKRNLGELSYREKDSTGNLKNFVIQFTPSPDCGFYAISINSDKYSKTDFIYDNAYFKPDSSKILESLDKYANQYRWIQNVNTKAPSAEYKIEWFDTWFYSSYTVFIYAADKNFADFTITNTNVQEFDGNFHEPKMHIEGDGIGVFGSAIAEVAFFAVKK